MNHKGRLLAVWLDNNDKYTIQNHGMKTSLRSDTIIDLVLKTPTISLAPCGTLSYTGSDHLPILMELNGINLQDNNYIISKTYWEIYKNILTIINPCVQKEKEKTYQDKPSKWFTFSQQLLEALKERVTIYHQTAQQRSTLSSSLRLMLKKKHYLQIKYRHGKLEEDRIRLRSWNKLVQYELKSFRQNNWMNFISEVAFPNPTHCWKTVKRLNKKRTASFSAITENDNIYKTPEKIVNCLQNHFSSRFIAPTLNMDNSTDVLAFKLWNELSNSSHEDIELVCENSDLKFTTQDLKSIIRKMNTKNSLGFDKDRTTTIDYQGHVSDQIVITRGAPQGSCFGPKAYIVNLFDLPQIFECPREVHLYVDDLAILYSPSIYLKYIKQTNEIQTRINNDMVKLEQYADNNHQPVYKNKTESVDYHKSVQVPKIRIVYQGQCIQQQRTFKSKMPAWPARLPGQVTGPDRLFTF
ncbi:unnamed protein product [Rotaria magnacalcarata]|uniref:Reverse transcriptase domain-containing protein n=1 Tax=Rotaria magnacalcarata TaxID=392030 RepID=A0A815ACA0_9BILA|nr:unnamed protein product [Rotaria magnacalcarata]